MIALVMRRYLRIGALVAVLAALVGFWSHGYRAGSNAVESRLEAARQEMQSELDDAGERIAALTAEMAARAAAQSKRALEIEDEARRDFDVCRVPSAGSLQRLGRRWDTP